MSLSLANLGACAEYHRAIVRSEDAYDEWTMTPEATAALIQVARAADAFVAGGITEYQLAMVVGNLHDELKKVAP